MAKRIFLLLLFILAVLCNQQGFAQTVDEDTTSNDVGELEQVLEKGNPDYVQPHGYTSATFQSTRIINGHSVENTGKGVLDFRISHRFGQVNEGIKNLYGLDNATTKFDFDYGITDWLTAGVGRNSFEKEYDGFMKFKLYRQTFDNKHPVSIGYVAGVSVRTIDVINIPGYNYDVNDRLYYTSQLLVARKFNKTISLQFMPTYIHYNLVSYKKDPNDIFALGLGGRLKVSKRVALTGEYYYTIPGHRFEEFYNSVSFGVDIETGGHVFQLFLTNSSAISERAFIGETRGNISNGDLHLGFNISRVFTMVRTKEYNK